MFYTTGNDGLNNNALYSTQLFDYNRIKVDEAKNSNKTLKRHDVSASCCAGTNK